MKKRKKKAHASPKLCELTITARPQSGQARRALFHTRHECDKYTTRPCDRRLRVLSQVNPDISYKSEARVLVRQENTRNLELARQGEIEKSSRGSFDEFSSSVCLAHGSSSETPRPTLEATGLLDVDTARGSPAF